MDIFGQRGARRAQARQLATTIDNGLDAECDPLTLLTTAGKLRQLDPLELRTLVRSRISVLEQRSPCALSFDAEGPRSPALTHFIASSRQLNGISARCVEEASCASRFVGFLVGLLREHDLSRDAKQAAKVYHEVNQDVLKFTREFARSFVPGGIAGFEDKALVTILSHNILKFLGHTSGFVNGVLATQGHNELRIEPSPFVLCRIKQGMLQLVDFTRPGMTRDRPLSFSIDPSRARQILNGTIVWFEVPHREGGGKISSYKVGYATQERPGEDVILPQELL